jgi:SAM-dependent methyltransferase
MSSTLATTKDFSPLRADYTFFETHATEAAEDLRAYASHVQSVAAGDGPIRLLDFGCGPGGFSRRFIEMTGIAADRLQLSLVEPVDVYRRQAIAEVRPHSTDPVCAWPALPEDCEACFDLVLANHVFYYVPDLEAALTGILRALAPSGLFLTAIAGQRNTLIQFWNRCFGLIGRPVPFHTAEDLERALTRLGRRFHKQDVHYELTFPDSEENRLTILRFLMGSHYPEVPRPPMLELFDSYAADGIVHMHITHEQFIIRCTE